MKINADFDQRVLVHSAAMDWLDSPMAGVERRPLDRVGGEVARATTVVRYAPDSRFSPHVHWGGEEFLVLEGVFQDEHGDYPAGTYVRNPPQSRHTPGSVQGCVIFVKLWQFDPDDRTQFSLDISNLPPSSDSSHPGVAEFPLFSDGTETVSIFALEPEARLMLTANQGAELFVLEGGLLEERLPEQDYGQNDLLQKHSWLRIPCGDLLDVKAGVSGARVWVKQGHLGRIAEEIARVQSA